MSLYSLPSDEPSDDLDEKMIAEIRSWRASQGFDGPSVYLDIEELDALLRAVDERDDLRVELDTAREILPAPLPAKITQWMPLVPVAVIPEGDEVPPAGRDFEPKPAALAIGELVEPPAPPTRRSLRAARGRRK